MISIKYHNGDRRRILIQIHDDGGPFWRRLRHTLLNRNPEGTFSENESDIVVPRLSFVSMYQEIFHAIRQMGFGDAVDIQAEVEEDLERFINLKNNRFDLSQPVPEISHDEILARLISSGWDMGSITPTEFQMRNLSRMCSFPEGAASFSVPGAGKTVEGCAFFAYHRNPNSKMIVTLPRVGYIAWEEDLEKCLGLVPGSDVIRIDGRVEENEHIIDQNPEATVFLITYERFKRNLELMYELLDQNDCFLVLDESHRIKNDSQRSEAIRSLSIFAKHRLILSGTPTPNETEDIERQFDFLYPGFNWPLNRIVDEMARIQVRTKKSDLGLLEPREFRQDVGMNPLQEELYNLIRDHEARRMHTIDLSDRNSLANLGRAVMTVIQAASNPMLLLKNPRVPLDIKERILDLVEEEGSEAFPKIEWTCKKARELVNSGEKVLIWSSFVENVKLIDSKLKDLGSRYIIGSTPSISGTEGDSDIDADNREGIIKAFRNDPNRRVLVANPAAAGESISLHHVCRHAIYVDRTYNAGNFVQSRDRIHRFGEKDGVITCREKDTFYYYLTTKRTIDERVNSSLSRKITNMARLLEDDSLTFEPIGIPSPQGARDFGLDEDDCSTLMGDIFGVDDGI